MRVFIFDLDGVIVDSMPLHTQCWLIYLERLGIPSDRLAERMHGKHNDEIVRELFGGSLTQDQVFGHGAAKERLYRELMAPRLAESMVPGVAAFLERHAHVPKGVASNAELANIEFVLEGSGLRGHFDVLVDPRQVRRPKPDPEIYLRATELLGARPAECVIFEDSPAGLAAARACGARVVAVNTARVELPDADLLVNDFLDPGLEPWLRKT
ncbi:MAG: HAD family phosphatase [Bryobacterales bacterium]|nr:HAD family phosphatase [Bryobacterales bacterium]